MKPKYKNIRNYYRSLTQICGEYIDTSIVHCKGDNFGNARDVRNMFENVLTAQANRVIQLKSPNLDDVRSITIDDIKTALC